VPRPSFPKTLRQFQSDFATEEACQQYLAACRWPDGFICPQCGHGRAYELVNHRRRQCAKCRHQVSLTSGTILHRTKTLLTCWFWAAYLMTTDKRGVSALMLQRQLGLSRYETAWMMLHKLRRAMVNTTREPLRGEVEVDDTWIGGEQAGLRGSRQLKNRRAALVLVAVEPIRLCSGWPLRAGQTHRIVGPRRPQPPSARCSASGQVPASEPPSELPPPPIPPPPSLRTLESGDCPFWVQSADRPPPRLISGVDQRTGRRFISGRLEPQMLSVILTTV
jgi:hypothetical protein